MDSFVILRKFRLPRVCKIRRKEVLRVGGGWFLVENNATLWLHLASWNLPDSQLSKKWAKRIKKWGPRQSWRVIFLLVIHFKGVVGEALLIFDNSIFTKSCLITISIKFID